MSSGTQGKLGDDPSWVQIVVTLTFDARHASTACQTEARDLETGEVLGRVSDELTTTYAPRYTLAMAQQQLRAMATEHVDSTITKLPLPRL